MTPAGDGDGDGVEEQVGGSEPERFLALSIKCKACASSPQLHFPDLQRAQRVIPSLYMAQAAKVPRPPH
jgi:hypothetical protein